MADKAQDKTPRPGRKRKWPRRLLIVGAIVLLLVVLAPLALALPFVRNAVAGKIGDALGRTVTIDSAFAFWGAGVDLEGITVASPDGFDEPLATVKHVHADLGVFALLTGRLDADLRIIEPQVALLKDAEGRSNADGIGGTGSSDAAPGEPASTSDAEESDARLHVEVVDGIVRAAFTGADRIEEVRDLDATLDFGPSGAMGLRATATALGAGADGKDAELDVDLHLTRDGRGTMKATIPPLDLSRLAAIVEGVTGASTLRGRFDLDMDVERHNDGRLAGKLDAEANGFVLRVHDGLRLATERITMKALATETQGNTKADVTVTIRNVEVLDDSGAERRKFVEPLIELVLKGTQTPGEKRIVIDEGHLQAGRAISIVMPKPWVVVTSEPSSARGELRLNADLGLLRDLRALIPGLDLVRAGKVGAHVVADADAGLTVRAGLWVTGLDIAPNDLSPAGYTENQLVAEVQIQRDENPDAAPTRVRLLSLESSVAALKAPAPGEAPLELSLDDAGIGATGGATFALRLEPAARAFGGALGLERSDTMRGVLDLKVAGDMADGVGTARMSLHGPGITLPASWAPRSGQQDLIGSATATLEEDAVRIVLDRLTGRGWEAKGNATLSRGDAPHGDVALQANLSADPLQACPLLLDMIGLPGDAQVTGALVASVNLEELDGTRKLTGRTTVDRLLWRDGTGAVVLQEPRLEIVHDVTMPRTNEGTRYVFDDVKLVAQALGARVEGAATIQEGGRNPILDTKLVLDGDAARLAGVLRNMLGEDYSDLTGTGRIDGSFAVTGTTSHGGESLVIDGSLKPGTWSAGGLTLADGTLKVSRASPNDPLGIALVGGLNGGSLDVALGVGLTTTTNPWNLAVTMKRVDTAPLLVDHGVGEYLTWFLPTFLPTDKATPVLNGLLDADVRLSGPDLGAEDATAQLQGDGSLRMDQGSIGDSTLFRVVGGGQGLGKVGGLLVKAVPEVGRVFGGLQKSLTFERMESDFSLAHRVVTVKRGLLDGRSARIDFSGNVGFNDAVNLKVDVTLPGKDGERLAKVLGSPTIPLAVRGTLSQPAITPNIDAAKLAGNALGGLLPEGVKNPLDRLKDLIPK